MYVCGWVFRPDKNGVMPGVGSQTGISVGTSTAHIKTHITGLRGHYNSTSHTIKVNFTDITDSMQENGGKRGPFLKPKSEKLEKVSVSVGV